MRLNFVHFLSQELFLKFQTLIVGFGVVTLASLLPVNCVLLLGLLLPKAVSGTAGRSSKGAEEVNPKPWAPNLNP